MPGATYAHTKSAIWLGSRVAAAGGAVKGAMRTLLLEFVLAAMPDRRDYRVR